MKTVFTLITLVLLQFSAVAQKGAKIEFAAPNNTLDYGKAYTTDNGSKIFEFTNTGNQPLIITEVKSTCGCTVPSKPTEPILPGKKGQIEVKYNMKPGKINKAITVESNATNVPEGRSILRITGEVVQAKENSLMEKKNVGPMN